MYISKCLLISCFLIFVSNTPCFPQQDLLVTTELTPGMVKVSAPARLEITGLLKTQLNRNLIVASPDEIRALIVSLEGCDTALAGWDKNKFLKDWREAEADIGRFATLLLEKGSALRSQSQPFVNLPPTSRSSNRTLSPNVQQFIDQAKKRGLPIEVLPMAGIPGDPVIDPNVLESKGLVSDEDVAEAVSKYVGAALSRHYDRFIATPSACYSPQQLDLIKARLKDTFGPQNSVARKSSSGQPFVEIECGAPNTSSRFFVARSELSPMVIKALADGPWPFGPAGLYFSRAWFLKTAVWQMFARESGKYRDNLSLDVADYSCGPP